MCVLHMQTRFWGNLQSSPSSPQVHCQRLCHLKEGHHFWSWQSQSLKTYIPHLSLMHVLLEKDCAMICLRDTVELIYMPHFHKREN